MTNKKLRWGPGYLDWYYKGGVHQLLTGAMDRQVVEDKIEKAVGVWDAPTSPYAYYFEPKFSAAVQSYVERNTEVYKLLPKTTFQDKGDSLKYWESDLSGLQGVTGSSTPFASGSAESAPSIATLEEFEPAYMVDPWETGITARTRASWQSDPKLDPAWIKQYHADLFPDQLDACLTRRIGDHSNSASNANVIESIDRILSANGEDNSTNAVVPDDNAADIHWGQSTALIDRSGDSDDTFGCGAGDGLDIPSSANARVLSLDMIDDVMAAIVPYSRRKRYIGLTGPKTLNEMQQLIDPKQRFLDTPTDVQFTINGVQTRKGAKTGFTVASYIANGIEIPFFTSRHVPNETSGNRSATVTDADIGNIYIIDLDAIEVRTAMPTTYLETPPAAMLTGDIMKTRHMFLYAAQLVAENFRAHGSIKYLKSS